MAKLSQINSLANTANAHNDGLVSEPGNMSTARRRNRDQYNIQLSFLFMEPCFGGELLSGILRSAFRPGHYLTRTHE